MSAENFIYFVQGLTGRLTTIPNCPSCAAKKIEGIDRKYFHHLLRCRECGLLFRYPRESEKSMARFYQRGYKQSGLTTDLPEDDDLGQLMKRNFSGTSKDFTRFINLFEALSISRGAKILDYGANWGYGMYQFQKAGFAVSGYEISKSRAAFGQKLGLSIRTAWPDVVVSSPFDVAFSAHVLEHTPNPAEAIDRQISLVRPGGLLVAVFPHGSPAYRDSDFEGFHRLWGRVHPVLPTVDFLEKVLPSSKWFIGSMTDADLQRVTKWDGMSSVMGDTTRSELLVVYRT